MAINYYTALQCAENIDNKYWLIYSEDDFLAQRLQKHIIKTQKSHNDVDVMKFQNTVLDRWPMDIISSSLFTDCTVAIFEVDKLTYAKMPSLNDLPANQVIIVIINNKESDKKISDLWQKYNGQVVAIKPLWVRDAVVFLERELTISDYKLSSSAKKYLWEILSGVEKVSAAWISNEVKKIVLLAEENNKIVSEEIFRDVFTDDLEISSFLFLAALKKNNGSRL